MAMMSKSNRKLNRRAGTMLLVFLVWAGLVMLRLFWVQIVENDRYEEWSLRQTRDVQELYSERGTIYDRNGNPLAFSLMVKSLYADPGMMNVPPEEAARLLAEVLPEDASVLAEK